jgi:type 1 fimbriae regulatory protein FimB/type 1 fimbriae regulatory protein FimE
MEKKEALEKATKTMRQNYKNRHREYLYPEEVEQIIQAVEEISKPVNKLRNRTMTIMAYKHGLRAGEVCNLKWTQIAFHRQKLYVRRLKDNDEIPHPLTEEEIRLLLQLRKRNMMSYDHVFLGYYRKPVDPQSFGKLIRKAGQHVGFDFVVHPHMLRHACGFKLANDDVPIRVIQEYLGHKSIDVTLQYTKLKENKFQGLFD